MKTQKQRKNKTTKAVIAALLSLLMLLTAFPAEFFSVFAEDGEPALEEPEALEEVEYEPDEEADALYEMTELRTADTKYIKMSDGTVNAVVYDAAVHRKDESGEWTDIDNSLEEGENSFDSSRVSFIKEASGESALFTLRDGSRKITVSMPEAKDSTPIAVINDGKTDGKFDTVYEELTTLTKTFSSVRYNGILPNTDAEYILKGGDLKENLIINEHCEYYTYTFELLLENLIATLAEDGSILLTAEEETAYVFPAPYMYDAEGDCSDAVFYTLEEVDGDKYILTVTADEGWINDPSRTFPVTVDPTIITFGYSSSIEDTYVVQNTSSNYSTSTVMYVGKMSQNAKTKAFVRINNMPNAVGLPLLSVKLTMKCVNTASSLAGKSIAVDKVGYTGAISSITYSTTFSAVHRVINEPVVVDQTEYTFNLLDADFMTSFSQASSACYRFKIDTSDNGTITFATSERASSMQPRATFKFGYMPLSGLSNQTIWIADTYQPTGTNDFFNVGILKTLNGSGVAMTTYGNGQQARGQFQLITGTSGMRIYGCYDMVELYADGSTSGSDVTTGTTGEDWIILKLNNGKYVILLSRDPRLAMTRDGTSVKVQTYTGGNDQLWVLYKGTTGVGESHPIDSGIYYINNAYTKEFLVNDRSGGVDHLELSSATEAAYGDKMAWRITYAGSGKYMIQSVINPTKYLSVDTYAAYLEQHNNSLGNQALFNISKFQTSYYIKSGTGFYMCCNETGALEGVINLSSGEPNLYLWRLCKKSEYQEYQPPEVNDYQLLLGEQKSFQIANYYSSEYTYSVASSEFEAFTVSTGTGFSISHVSGNTYSVTSSPGSTPSDIINIATVRHIPTGKVVSLGRVWIGDAIWSFELDGYRLAAQQNAGIVNVGFLPSIINGNPLTSQSLQFGEQLWYTEYVEKSGTGSSTIYYYYVHSLHVRDSSYGDDNVLTYNGSVYSLSKKTNADNQKWAITKDGNYYKIRRKGLSTNLEYNFGSGVIDDWTLISANEMNMPKCYWEGNYTSLINTHHIKITIGNEVSSTNSNLKTLLTNTNYYNDLYDIWNNSTDRIVIHYPGDPMSGITDYFEVTITQGDLSEIDANAVGITLGNNQIGCSESDWQSCSIIIDENHIYMSIDILESAIRHELGHALKLSHKFSEQMIAYIVNDNGEIATIEINGHTYNKGYCISAKERYYTYTNGQYYDIHSGNLVDLYSNFQFEVLSLMLHGTSSNNAFITNTPTFLDKYDLIRKWGV